MKHFYLLFGAATVMFCSTQAFAQCEPDFDFGEAEWGASPDATAGEQFDTAYVFTPYADVFHVLVPTDASAIDPLFALPLDSVVLMSTILVDTVSQQTIALEDIGLEIVCNNLGSSPNPCTLISGEQYCASLEGTPTLAGVYQMTLMVEAYVTVFGVPVAQPYEFSGYVLDVLNIPFGINDFNSKAWNAFPNPTSDYFNLSALPQFGTLLVSDLSGRTMIERQLNSIPANTRIDSRQWANGMYLVQVQSGGTRSVKQLLIQH
tara:strand:- start:1336 stop:2121 length:786 start_codon:yes stop_codon:yes gene_type:complete